MKDLVPVIRALIDAVLLLESAGPDEINPDTAVRGMENIASSLLALEKSDQQALRGHLLHIAESAQDQTYASFVRSLPEMLGLAED
jgi:hypothetical protein